MLLYEEKQNGQGDLQASKFCTYDNYFPAIFIYLSFHLLKSPENYSRGKYLQWRSAPLQKTEDITLLAKKNSFSSFCKQTSFGQYLLFVGSSVLEVQPHLHWGWPNFHRLQQQHQLKLFLCTFVLHVCPSSSVPALPPL